MASTDLPHNEGIGPDWAVDVARRFHEEYERQAPHFGYETRPESAVEWDDVPEKNKRLMVRTVCGIFTQVRGPSGTIYADPDRPLYQLNSEGFQG